MVTPQTESSDRKLLDDGGNQHRQASWILVSLSQSNPSRITRLRLAAGDHAPAKSRNGPLVVRQASTAPYAALARTPQQGRPRATLKRRNARLSRNCRSRRPELWLRDHLDGAAR